MSLSLFFALTLTPFLSAWIIAEGVRQFVYARKLAKALRELRREH